MIKGIYQRIFSGCCVKPISLSIIYKVLQTKQLNSYLPILLFLIFSVTFFFAIMSDLLKKNIFISMTQKINRQNLQGEQSGTGAELNEWDRVIPLSWKAKNNFLKIILFLLYALFKVLRKCILQASNNTKMKNSIWHNVVDTLCNFTVNIEKIAKMETCVGSNH